MKGKLTNEINHLRENWNLKMFDLSGEDYYDFGFDYPQPFDNCNVGWCEERKMFGIEVDFTVAYGDGLEKFNNQLRDVTAIIEYLNTSLLIK